ncbi:hypothetical protein SAMN05216524_102470 [Mucilaginibacter sp. OK098]|nr:hypothetical protein SAMN05216524_102470 [Mucilaginibacter sp. OK098]
MSNIEHRSLLHYSTYSVTAGSLIEDPARWLTEIYDMDNFWTNTQHAAQGPFQETLRRQRVAETEGC